MGRAAALSVVIHFILLGSFFSFTKSQKNIVKFDANILRLSLSGIKIKKSDSVDDSQVEKALSDKAKNPVRASAQKGKDKVDAMSCMNLKARSEIKTAGVQLPRRYFVQVYTDNAAVEGAWYVDKWLPEAPAMASVDKKLFEAFAECIRNSNFSEWGRKAVNFAAARRSISFAVEFFD